MKSKRIIIIFLIIIFFAAAVVLTGVLFRVGDFRVVSVSDVFEEAEAEKIKESLLLDYRGKSIFFLDEKSIADKVETEFPYIRVVNIERRFPKEVYITVQERIEVYCFKIGKDYVYTDYNCKILRIEESKQEIYDSKYGQVIEVILNENMISNYKADEQNIGKILEFFKYGATNFLTELYLNTTNDPVFFRKYIKNVNISNFYNPDGVVSGSRVDLEMCTGAKFTFFKASEYGEKLISYMNGLMENDASLDRIDGIYEISYDGDYIFRDITK